LQIVLTHPAALLTAKQAEQGKRMGCCPMLLAWQQLAAIGQVIDLLQGQKCACKL
jgi:hypothetical protein